MSRQKQKGTSFETSCARWLTEALGVPVERRALHGSKDMGDLFGLVAHGWRGIAECKDHKNPCRADVERWRAETLDERANADADFSVLVIHCDSFGKCGSRADSPTFKHNRCDLTVADLWHVAPWLRCAFVPEMDERWISMTLGDLVALMGADDG